MKTLKTFSDWDSLNEGRYDKVTGDIVKDLMNLIKATNNGKDSYDGIKITYTQDDDVPSFEDLIEDEEFLDAGTYWDFVSGVDVFVKLLLIRDEMPTYEDDYIIDGHVDEDLATVYIEISMNPEREPGCYNDLSYELRDVVRHEIEHLTQRGWNENPAKKRKRNFGQRSKIQSSGEYHKYYTLGDEVDANLQGLYNKAKSMKKPYKDVVMDFIESRVKRGIIPEDKIDQVYNTWKKRAKIIGGLPEL